MNEIGGNRGGYLELFRVRGVLKILVAQLVARLPAGMLSIVILIHTEQAYSSFAAAGAVLAVISITQSIFAPLVGRLTTMWGVLPVMLVSTVLCCLSLLLLALWPMPLPGAVVLGSIIGISLPPVQSVVRTLYPKLVADRMTGRLFSVDASLQEIIWIIGPMLITFAAIVFSSAVGLMLSALIMLSGVIWLTLCREIHTLRIPRTRYSFGRILRKHTVWITTLVGLLIIGSTAALETAVVASFRKAVSPALGEAAAHTGHEVTWEAGALLAIWAAGSLIGGFAFGHRPITPWSLTIRSIPVLVGSAAAAFSNDFWWLAGSLFISGVGLAPAIAAMFTMVSATVRFSQTPEAFGWLASGQLVGAALISALSGILIDLYSPQAAFILGAATVLLCLVLAALLRPLLPDLREKTTAESLYTSPITLPINVVSQRLKEGGKSGKKSRRQKPRNSRSN